MGTPSRASLAHRLCPRCHASIDWQVCDPAYSDAAEYRICPECDEAVFVAWRTERGSTDRAGATAEDP